MGATNEGIQWGHYKKRCPLAKKEIKKVNLKLGEFVLNSTTPNCKEAKNKNYIVFLLAKRESITTLKCSEGEATKREMEEEAWMLMLRGHSKGNREGNT